MDDEGVENIEIILYLFNQLKNRPGRVEFRCKPSDAERLGGVGAKLAAERGAELAEVPERIWGILGEVLEEVEATPPAETQGTEASELVEVVSWLFQV
jgi:hypothetical protein